MANLDQYWDQITKSEGFQDLAPEQKEKVRSSLFDKYVQTSDSYLNLPQSQRISVKQHFDKLTTIKPETFGESVSRETKPLVQGAKSALKTAEGAYQVMPTVLEKIQPGPMKAGYKAMGAAAGAIEKGS